MVYTLLADGFEEIEALTVVDILRRAEIPVKTVSLTSDKTVVGGHGINVVADCSIGEVTVSDMLFLPGGMPGVTNLYASDRVRQLINEFNNNQKFLAFICAASSIPGKMGILAKKNACCYPGFEKDLHDAQIKYDKVVKDGNIITSRGAGTAAELGFTIVSLLKDQQTADKLRKGMIYE